MYVVTGGAGFIGRWIIEGLNRRGISDILVVDRLRNKDKYKNLVGLEFEDFIDKQDFLNQIEAGGFNKNIKAVFHMGACSSTTEFDADFLIENNYRYSKVLALWALDQKARFIYASSAATYGDGSLGYSDETKAQVLRPLNPYGFSKVLFDHWIERNGLDESVVGLKFFNVYGPNEEHKGSMRSVVHKAFGQIQSVKKVELFDSHHPDFKDGEQLRDFIYVKDVIKVIFHFFDQKDQNGIFNVGTGKARSFKDLAQAAFSAMGVTPKIDFIKMPEEIRTKYQYFTQAEMSKLRKAGFDQEFTSLEDGVKDYIQNHLIQS